VAETPPPPELPVFLNAPALGVALGPVATSIDPPALAPGTSGTLTIRGSGFTGITGVALVPDDGATLGTPIVGTDGSTMQVSVTIATGQPNRSEESRVGEEGGEGEA